MTPYPRLGQIWVAQPRGDTPPFQSWKRFVRIYWIDEKHNKIHIRSVEKRNNQWVSTGRRSTARLSRFNGGYWNYAFAEDGNAITWLKAQQKEAAE
jgi:hypothetical protein